MRDQVVEQRHLAADLANRGRCGFFRQKLRQRPLTGIEIEGRDQAAFTEMSNRASNVLPTRGRGDATMVMELRNAIA
jgi:hypothetical protein